MKGENILRQTRLLMTLSLIGLTVFLGYWLYQSYNIERHHLEKEVNFTFMTTIRTVEDSLLHIMANDSNSVFSMDIGGAFARGKMKIFSNISNAADSSKVKMSVVRMNHQGEDDRRGSGNRRSHYKFPGLIGYYLLNNSASGFVLGEDTLKNEVNKILNSAFANQLNSKEVPNRTSLIIVHPDSIVSANKISSFLYKDDAAELNMRAVAAGVPSFIFLQIWPQILIAILLLSLTSFTFYRFYKNQIEQQILLEAREQLVSNMAHELKTPITTTQLALEELNSRVGSNEKEYVGMATTELNRLTELSEKILMGAKQGTLVLNRTYENLSELTREVINRRINLQPQLTDRIELNESTSEDSKISMDKEQMRIVLENLLDNAIKYSQPDPEIVVNILESQKELIWSLRDNGQGIPDIYQKRVFEKLFRVPDGNIHNVKGYGIGLAIVKEIVEAHDGKIELKSKAGVGTTMTLRLNKK